MLSDRFLPLVFEVIDGAGGRLSLLPLMQQPSDRTNVANSDVASRAGVATTAVPADVVTTPPPLKEDAPRSANTSTLPVFVGSVVLVAALLLFALRK